MTGASKIAEEEFEKQYPAVYNHLLSFKEQLSARNKDETGIRYEWYALQRWGANYWEDFFKPKIIFQEIVQESSFMIDVEDHFFCLDTGRIITGDNLEFLLSILNSKIFFFAIKHFYGGGGLGSTGVRMKHTFFEHFPCINEQDFIKILSEKSKQIIERKAMKIDTSALEREIEATINNAYGLTEEDVQFISNQ